MKLVKSFKRHEYKMNPRAKSVVVADDYKLKLVFANGETGVFDCSPLLDIGVFQELRDKNYFRRVKAEYGTVTWPHEQDICPDTLYIDSERKTMCKSEQ